MSGSPIYLDGRFAGALAFGWGGALRPLAGVTRPRRSWPCPTDAGTPLQDAESCGPDLLDPAGLPGSSSRPLAQEMCRNP